MTATPTVLVLGGGPDAERDVSLQSAAAVAEALEASGRYAVRRETIDRPTPDELAAMPGDVVFPALHGPYGEGGPLQALLEDAELATGRPFVGCRAPAARTAMDKIATKIAAARLGLAVAPAGVINPRNPEPPVPAPCIVKPAHEGSSVGLFVCRRDDDWPAALAALAHADRDGPPRAWMAEALVPGREFTIGVVDAGRGDGSLQALPPVEVVPVSGVYDFEAKYRRDDTAYRVGPDPGIDASGAADAALALCRALGVRHVARVDFILASPTADAAPGAPGAVLLEINTMPGFTPASLLPKAAEHAGLPLPELVARFADAALAGALARRPAGANR